jgi:hypothetical protein
MSGIYQLNQATGSVTLPSSGNTFIGTSTNSELYSVDSSGTVTVYGTGSGGGGGGTIDTGSFATTGSNTFTGVNTFSNNVAITSSSPVSFTLGSIFSLSNPTGSMQFTGSINASGSLTVNGPITISGSGTVITSTQTGSFGSTNTGSFATTGSNVFSGSQEITGSLTISGSLFVSGNTINNIGPFNQTGLSTFTGDIISSGNISASGTVISSGVNIDTTDTSSSFDIGTGEHIIPVWSGMNVSSSGIISQAYPSGRIGRTTEIIGDATFDLGGGSYPVDGHHVMYHSGSRELWRATGEWDLSAFAMPRSVAHLLKYGDGNIAGNAYTFNDYELIVGENINDVWGGAYLMARQSGSTYGANTQYAGFFASASLGLPGTPQGHDKAFTIYTGQTQTGKAFNIYNANDPDDLSGADPVFSVSSSGATTIKGLPTAEPSTTGSLWISGSSVAHPNSGYLMVFNP